MFHIESSLSDVDFAKLNFSEKMSMAKDLAINYGLTIFMVFLLGTVFIGLLSIVIMLFADLSVLTAPFHGNGIDGSAIWRLGIGSVVVGIICLLFAVGVNTLILYYIDGNEPYSIFAIVMEPWANLSSVVWSVLLWLGAGLICGIIMGVVSLIPVVGSVIGSIGYLFFLMIIYCAVLYLADRAIYRNEEVSVWHAFLDPIAIVKKNIVSWLQAMAVIIVLSLPAALLMGFGVVTAFDGKSGVFIFCAFLSIIYYIAISIFNIFLIALTYRQTSAQPSAAGEIRS